MSANLERHIAVPLDAKDHKESSRLNIAKSKGVLAIGFSFGF